MATRIDLFALVLAALLVTPLGCGEPSPRELKNRQELEALLTAVSLKNKVELEKDALRINARHESGELSDRAYKDLSEIVARARAGDWAGAERRAYEFRETTPYFK
jgi:hypothetical protein